MAANECERQSEAFELVSSGQWPHFCGAEIHAHLDACPICRDLVAVVGAIHSDLMSAAPAVSVPPSGVMWWRAQRRAREEAARSAARLTTAVQLTLLGAGGLIALAAFLSLLQTSPWRSWVARAGKIVSDVPTLMQFSIPLAVGLAACLALAPIAIYVAVAKE